MKSMVLIAAAAVAFADALPGNFISDREHAGVAARYIKGVQQPIESPTLSGSTIQGCYKSSGKLKFMDALEWNSIGSCGNDLCRAQGYEVGGTTGGNQCWCGHKYPPKGDLVDPKNCDAGCTGYGDHACGGVDFWTIYHTGITLSVKYEDPPKKSTTSDTPKATHTESSPQETIIVTESPTSEPEPEGGSSGPNVAGIAAGVVVGVVVIASALGGGFLYMRRKRNQEIEEEHRRNAAVNAFIGKPPRSSGGTSTTDSRMDPVMAHRRMSDGSIADNQDYSRRILRVTNA